MFLVKPLALWHKLKKGLSARLVGLAYQYQTLKVVDAEANGKDLLEKFYCQYPLENSSEAFDKKLLQHNHSWNNSWVAICIPSHLIYSQKIESTLSFDHLFLMPLEKLVVRSVAKQEQSKLSNPFIFAANSEDIYNLLKPFEMIIPIDSLIPEPIALAALGHLFPDITTPLLLIYISPECTTCILSEKGYLIDYIFVPYGKLTSAEDENFITKLYQVLEIRLEGLFYQANTAIDLCCVLAEKETIRLELLSLLSNKWSTLKFIDDSLLSKQLKISEICAFTIPLALIAYHKYQSKNADTLNFAPPQKLIHNRHVKTLLKRICLLLLLLMSVVFLQRFSK
ncbi:MAG: hypothetical protein K0S74_234 [Chlamydiales bacterium]|nr:hypothetical protein [Chlamydiales bacterium]